MVLEKISTIILKNNMMSDPSKNYINTFLGFSPDKMIFLKAFKGYIKGKKNKEVFTLGGDVDIN